MSRPIVYQAASVCLGYPDEGVLGLAGVIRRALTESAPAAEASFAPLLDWWATTPAAEVQRAYVDVFDLSKRHALYLSYWTDGDTRRRGMVLAEFKQRYREAGLVLGDTGELPDHLPLVLEYARHRPDDGADLLQSYRASLELIRIALAERGSPYAGVVAAVCATLPGRSPEDRQQAMAMAAAGPPSETVGLDGADPRLIPLESTGAGLPAPTGVLATGGRR
ncbi:nitrate reductase molybdenum cofactor assembly chaperone [Agromyces intestinalis]|uniref:Nitrate reductase molybdenum cofactor assembly chaperone n=1 Tax=Agromyces intestinalis TaxID=2592652 RepID=A0A5C1YCZ1_9MICO|nr:nitrate reductase molybdenum cofactor assembly chaperone [Agromyces intestinalis]QEO13876.1 nitrate reductase molybdenum cofactor assembly chaperone [Agromyces intestinalis]